MVDSGVRRARRSGGISRWLALTSLLATLLVGALPASPAGAAAQDGGDPPPNVNWGTLEGEPVQQWGVVGAGVSNNDPKPQVWDMAEIGTRIYVGGIFTGVQQNAFNNTPIQNQAYLAAFDRDSGAWISTFRPTFNASVYALEVSPDGSLLVGGEFTSVNGQARTGLVALDPATGDIRTSFAASVARIGVNPGPAMVRELYVDGANLYVAGTFNQHVLGGTARFVYQVVRVNANGGQLDTGFLPRPTGSGVWDVIPDNARGRVHLVGYFSSVNAQPGTANMVTVTSSTGAIVGGLTEFVTNDPNQTWTRAITLANDRLYVGGAEHVLQVLDAGSRNRLGYSTTGVGCTNFVPTSCPPPIYIGGGDMQVVEQAGNAILSGCHCFLPRAGFRPAYDNRTHYSSFTGQSAGLRNVIAYDPVTSAPLSWVPGLRENTWGAWGIHVDRRGCVYVGGDYTRTDAGLWVGGFGRFCNPVTAPAALSATSSNGAATLSWTAPSSQLPVLRYRVYRAGTFIGETAGLTFTDDGQTAGQTIQYSVETVDVSNRRSPRANVSVTIGAADTQPPTTPPNLTAAVNGTTVTLTWGASTDNVGVRGYLVHRDFQFVAFVTAGTTYSDANVANGSHTYQVRGQDAAGNNSTPAQVNAQIGAPDVQPPTAPPNVTAQVSGSTVTLSWGASTDNVGVRGYLVHRDFAFIAFVPAGTTYTNTGVPAGARLYQIRAQDAAGNNSTPTALTVNV